ncbi:MAG: hypothetical protein E7632_09585 [Ruminococcaceae bacterium]|nr:hypothetical protein [Oscillospiraceae bacterium]
MIVLLYHDSRKIASLLCENPAFSLDNRRGFCYNDKKYRKEAISVQYFFETVETIKKGVGFKHFDAVHLMWLAVGILTVAAAAFFCRRADDAGRRRMAKFVAGLLIADELFKVVCLVTHGLYIPKYLPLHLCSINIILIAVHAFRPTKTLDNFLYAICIPSAMLALLFPTWTKLPLANFMHIHSFTVHILLLAYPVMLLAAGMLRPSLGELPKTLALLAGLAVVALVVNLIFDTNFMFLMSAGKTNPLYIFKKAFGSHLWGFPVLIPAVLAVMYIPVCLYDRHRRKKAGQQ